MISRRDIPNLLTALRIVLVAPILLLLAEENYAAALLLFAVAGVSDGLDGYLAKRNGWVTRLGSILDPLADKLLLVCCYVVLGWNGLVPLWLVVVILGRDLLIVGGGILYHIRIGRFDAQPSLISKFNTLVQIILVLAVVAERSWGRVPPVLLPLLVDVVAITTIASGLGYVWDWGRRAWSAPRDRGN